MRAQMNLQLRGHNVSNLQSISNGSPTSSTNHEQCNENDMNEGAADDVNLQNVLDNSHRESTGSFLSLSHTVYNINSNQPIKIAWDIKESVSSSDWIGLYKLGMYFL